MLAGVWYLVLGRVGGIHRRSIQISMVKVRFAVLSVRESVMVLMAA